MSKQTQSFNAEIKQLLDIVIHSLYSNRDVFIRELISNASDAIDKLKFQSLTQAQLVPANWSPEIRLTVDEKLKTLKISDNGIGMNLEEVHNFIGTIAKSGAKAFAQMNEAKNGRPDLIGQFGVGFYSAFMVASKVTLHTQKAGTQDGVVWESTGEGTYSVDTVPRPEGTGTTITLHLKDFKADSTQADDTASDYTDRWTLKSLVKKYSDFIPHPIVLTASTESTESEKNESKDETLNSMKALWLKSPSEISEEEHKEFYKTVAKDWNDPLHTIHYKAEGTMEFTTLAYIPKKKPWNYMNQDREYGLSLYVKKVFIMADCKELLPSYLRFVRGLVDSSDLSLNVSRELLQQDRQVAQIKKNVTSKILSSLKDLLLKNRTEYENFWSEFGTTLKEGIPNDPGQAEKLKELLLFHSSNSDKMITLKEYTERMQPDQKEIFFITGERLEQVKNSPYLEKLKAKNYEVLLLVDPVDEWLVNSLPEYNERKLRSVMHEGLTLEEGQTETPPVAESYKELVAEMKNHLSAEVKDVVPSSRLVSSAAVLVASENDPSAHMQKLLSQIGGGQSLPPTKRILEVNLNHPLFEKMKSATPEQLKVWAEILYNQALLTEGSQIPDPVKFSSQISELIMQASNAKLH